MENTEISENGNFDTAYNGVCGWYYPSILNYVDQSGDLSNVVVVDVLLAVTIA